MLSRATEAISVTFAFTPLEIDILSRVGRPQPDPKGSATLRSCVVQLAKLGGYLARAG